MTIERDCKNEVPLSPSPKKLHYRYIVRFSGRIIANHRDREICRHAALMEESKSRDGELAAIGTDEKKEVRGGKAG